jgi:HSP20 family molecular chaperone IbpA
MTRRPSLSKSFPLGFDEIERVLDRAGKAAEGYPLYNIERIPLEGNGPERVRITLAVPGFTRDHLDVSIEESQLVIRGSQPDDKSSRYIHRRIPARKFQRTFVLADGMEVLNADLANGLLSIVIARFDPARSQPERTVKTSSKFSSDDSDPRQKIAASHPIGTRLQGRVSHVSPYGMFVELPSGIVGFVNAAILRSGGDHIDPSAAFAVDQQVDVEVKYIDRKGRIGLRLTQSPAGVQLVSGEFTPSEALVELFHNGLLAQYEILRATCPEEAREAPSLEYANTILAGRILEVIASRARRMQIGVLENRPLCVGQTFEYGFVQELSEHVPFRIDEGTEFFSQLHEELLAHLEQGGSIAGRWGRLVINDDKIAITTKDSADRVPTDDERRALFESRSAAGGADVGGA